jgi:hypothetical protein
MLLEDLYIYIYGDASIELKLKGLKIFGLLSKQHASPTLFCHISSVVLKQCYILSRVPWCKRCGHCWLESNLNTLGIYSFGSCNGVVLHKACPVLAVTKSSVDKLAKNWVDQLVTLSMRDQIAYRMGATITFS